MRNTVLVQADTIPVVSPTGGVLSGDLVVIGALAGVANSDAEEGKSLELTLRGAFALPKAAVAFSQGQKAFWNAGSKVATTTASGNVLIGAAISAAPSDAATVVVRLNGSTT